MPKRERPEKRPERRRRRDPAPEQPARAPRSQHITIVDAVSAEQHREDQRHHLAPRVGRPRPIPAQPHHTTSEILDPEPPRERRDEHDPSIRNRPLVIEHDIQAVQSDSLVIMHHEGDLLTAGRDRCHRSLFTCSGGHS